MAIHGHVEVPVVCRGERIITYGERCTGGTRNGQRGDGEPSFSRDGQSTPAVKRGVIQAVQSEAVICTVSNVIVHQHW